MATADNTRGPGGSACGNTTCVDIKPNGDMFDFVSTVSPDRGKVSYDRGEVAQFFTDVKAGNWDHLL